MMDGRKRRAAILIDKRPTLPDPLLLEDQAGGE